MKRPRLFIAVLCCFFLFGCDSKLEEALVVDEPLVIAYAEPITDYSPLGYQAKDRKYLANIYEPLVRYDARFNPDTALAVAWGRLDDLTWEFRLREDVLFHDGTEFDSEDVVYSIKEAMYSDDSELKDLLSGIEEVLLIAENRIQIKTYEPDPLLLNRLTNVYIFPSGYSDYLTPTGTGPYFISGFEEGDLILSSFQYYWGGIPSYREVVLRYLPSVDGRYEGLATGLVDVLANVPPQYVDDLNGVGVDIVDFPSLESSFLVMNPRLLDEGQRKQIWSGLGSAYAQELGGGYLVDTDQYAASGIMGYVPNWQATDLDVQDYEFSITVDLPEGLNVLGELIKRELSKSGVEVNVSILTLGAFEEKIYSGSSEAYFFGWKYDLADVSDFYESVAHSSGEFNGVNFKSAILDDLINEAGETLDLEQRRSLLTEIAEVYSGAYVAYPLFESKLLYGVHPDVDWDLRLDGLILASEIHPS